MPRYTIQISIEPERGKESENDEIIQGRMYEACADLESLGYVHCDLFKDDKKFSVEVA